MNPHEGDLAEALSALRSAPHKRRKAHQKMRPGSPRIRR